MKSAELDELDQITLFTYAVGLQECKSVADRSSCRSLYTSDAIPVSSH